MLSDYTLSAVLCLCRCSGDDGVHVCERATPRISRCIIQGKKCGVWVYDKARPVFNDCTIEDCGLQGLKLFDTALVRMLRWRLRMCSFLGWKADVSKNAKLVSGDCSIKDCCPEGHAH